MMQRQSSVGSKELRRPSHDPIFIVSLETEEKQYIQKIVSPTLEDLSLIFWQKPSDDPVAFFIELLHEQGVPDPPEIFEQVDQTLLHTLEAQVAALQEKIERIKKLKDPTAQKEDPVDDLNGDESAEKENSATGDNGNDAAGEQREDGAPNVLENSDASATTNKEDVVPESKVDDGAPVGQKEDAVPYTESDDAGSIEEKRKPPTAEEDAAVPSED